jgi:uncharacterized protein YkwD
MAVCLGLLPVFATDSPAFAKSGSATHAKKANRRQAHRRHRRHAHLRRAHERVRTHLRTRSQPSGEEVTPPATPAATEGSTAASDAIALATPCQNAELPPETGNLTLVREAVLCLINKVRAERGEPLLIENAKLELAAEQHSAELIEKDYFAHDAPDGTTPVDRIRRDGYIPNAESGYVIGENLAWGTYDLSTASEIVAAWLASPGHLANIVEGRYRETGIGVVAAVPPSLGDGSPGATYAQEFGVILG